MQSNITKQHRCFSMGCKANANVIISRPAEFERKRTALIEGGVHQLQLITDFDQTLTPQLYNGKPVASSFAILEASGMLSDRYHTRAKELYQKYAPLLKTDPRVACEYICKEMSEWCNQANENLASEKVPASLLSKMVAKAHTALRKGVDQFFRIVSEIQVPLLLFSAGVGDIIKEVFRRHSISLSENIHMIANFVDIDPQGVISTFKTPMIHPFNKNKVMHRDSPYVAQVSQRKNIILLGDHLADIGMSQGVDHETILSVGFLNSDVSKNLEAYTSTFDVVILNDGSLDFVVELLNEIAREGRRENDI